MPEIIGIRFRTAGKIYYFDPAGISLSLGDQVIVETPKGSELGLVVLAPTQMAAEELAAGEPLKPVLRKAEERDKSLAEEFKGKEKEAFAKCQELITKFNLSMKLLSAQYNFDGSRLTFSFSAEERVDFRELVRELSKTFKTKVELFQVGPRDETKMLGDFGRCGRNLCCASFLDKFEPVSIRMAKEQDLPLNPMKISGVCGRLLCCLSFENQQYREMKEKMPKVGQKVSTPVGEATVVGLNVLKETVIVELESGAVVELQASQVSVGGEAPPEPARKRRRKKRGAAPPTNQAGG